MMQGNFRRTVEPYRNNGPPNPRRGVAAHIAVFPRPRAHAPRQRRIESDRNCAGQTNLSAMSMSAEQHIEIGMRSLAIDLGGVREQYRKFVGGDLRHGLLNIVEPVVVGVIDTDQMDALTA